MTVKLKQAKSAPARHPATGRPPKYPLAAMKIGQFFEVTPNPGEDLNAAICRVRSAVSSWRHRHARGKISFIVRASDDKVGVWAVEPLQGE